MKALHYKYSDEEFIKLAQESESLSEFLIKLGYASGEGSGSRASVKERCEKLGIKPPLATGAAMTKKACRSNTKSVEEYFRKDCQRTGHTTRDKLIRENLLEYKCAICGNTGEWLGKPITLEVDHINGIHSDNRLENLRFLCPNCHAQTDTFRGKNKKGE